MAAEEKPAARGTLATVVATAAVTLAIGVTAAALGGYLVPASDGKKTRPEQVAEPVPAETPPAAPSHPPSIVLVPVAQDPRGEPPAAVPSQPEPEMLLAANEPTKHGDEEADHHQGRRHHEREHEDDHDDD